ncbi:MAG: aminoacyl-tRNA hydrolase [Candidatus Omnitrophica bacterium 4484_70.1]|nr:MAG: aminoacyl-tRNA hydrolase [Candidatus Omnitrophica bacterium 4484_70.1]
MKIILGLGNPTISYSKTRHNIGAMVVERIAYKEKLKFKKQKKMKAEIVNFQDNDLILAKPLVFMNESYLTVEGLLSYYKIPLDSLLVVYDDMDIPFGRIRFSCRGSSAGHKGIGSIIDFLGRKDIIRLRVGISHPEGDNVVEYVLSEFSEEEKKELPSILELSAQACLDWAKFGLSYVMQRYNRRN